LEQITKTKQKILQLLDQFRIDNEGQKVTQWNMLSLRAVIEQELNKLEQSFKEGEKNARGDKRR